MPVSDDTPTGSEGAQPAEVDTNTSTGRLRALLGAGLRWSYRNAYLIAVAAAVLVVTRVVEFSPPPEVRVGKADVAQLVGDAPTQEFSPTLSNPQAIQVRATLRLYADNQLPVSAPDPDTDAQSKLLSQPVVTTLLGMNATVEQTLRLEGGELQVDFQLNVTPRLGARDRGRKAPRPLTLEHELVIRSRQVPWWRGTPIQRVHLDSRGLLHGVEDDGYRLVFTVDDHLFSLDLELQRAGAAMRDMALTRSR